MEPLQIDAQPELSRPIAVLAYAGWNDAASAATNAARLVVRRLGARRFAKIDPEIFYNFQESRPSVRISASGARELRWPNTEFFYARNPGGQHDIVVGIGVEPNLRWATYVKLQGELLRSLGVELVVSLGALLADVPHTRPTRVTGSSTDPEVAERLNLARSRYEGPTGIVGVLHQVLREQSLPAMSLWANVPHYVTTSQNPPASSALLQRLEDVLGVAFDYRELKAASERFIREVNIALSAKPEMLEYVKQLEEALEIVEAQDRDGEADPGDPGDVVGDIERFLREQRPGED
ncbi:MAG: PAC2 family protein [Dehalococcoidia bacterium]|nr:PAC2 family protein [Dehalococcoidia bacterium]MCA9852632.1 PAC2 family protein [Dehalococcoidia bacterium]